jgi:hypothetical protein
MSRRIIGLFTLLALLCLGAGAASANWMGGFVLDRGASAYLGNTQQAGVSFQYKVTNTNGARFVVFPFNNGAVVAGYAWGGSPTYPAGSTGTATNYLTFSGIGTHVMDEFRVRMIDPVTSAVLLEIRLPVDYTFGDNAINEILFSHDSPSWLLNGDDFFIDFTYRTTEAAGARISARPFTGGALTPGYAASPVSVAPTGTGTGTQWFRFTSSTHDVDHIRFQVWNATQTTLLLEFFLPVELHWGDASISNLMFETPFPECLAWNQPVTVSFDYATTDVLGCRVWAYGEGPAHGFLTNQTYSSSSLLSVSGHVTRSFQLSAGTQDVAFVRFLMDNHDSSVRVLNVAVPVDYHYAAHTIRNVVFTPASPAVLDFNEHVDLTYDYVNAQAGSGRIQPLPYSWAGVASSYVVNGSPLYPAGSGSGTGFVTIAAGPKLVNRIGVHLYDSAWGGPVFSCYKTTAFTFGGIGGVTAAPELPAAVAAVAMGQNYPNPFNPLTNIPLDLDAPTRVTVKVFDLRGRLVETITDAVLPAGRTVLAFDGTRQASGEYLCVASSARGTVSRRLMLVK